MARPNLCADCVINSGGAGNSLIPEMKPTATDISGDLNGSRRQAAETATFVNTINHKSKLV